MAREYEDLKEYLTGILHSDFIRLTYTDAIKYLQQVEEKGEHKFEETPKWGIDLGKEHERYICEVKHQGPVLLYNYPKDIKAFYMRLNDDKKTV